LKVRKRLWMVVAVVAVLVAVAATGAFGSSSADATLERATTDRTDEFGGSQIHLMYVTSADGPDRGFDTNGQLAASVRLFNGWLIDQRGVMLKIDSFAGQPDISFLRLRQSDSDLLPKGIFIREAIEQEIRDAGFNKANTIYHVYYDGAGPPHCGGSLVPGSLSVLFIRGSDRCDENPRPPADATYPETKPGYFDFVTPHEVFHALGAVANCAPHSTGSFHVSDDPRDLMYAGSWDTSRMAIDPGGDDYWGPNVPTGCLNLANPPYNQYFEPEASLSVMTGGSGRVEVVPESGSCPAGTCTFKYQPRTPVTLSAIANSGYRFQGWGGDCTGGAGDCSLIMSTDKSVTATFVQVPKTFTLTVLVSGKGLVKIPPRAICKKRCISTLTENAKVTITAVPMKGHRFTGWSGACKGRGSCRPVINANRSLKATFR
jgi:Divergent InlB B-repeat domain